VEDGELLEKLAALCEIPGVMEGSFDPEFLALPREVLTTSLRDHQSALTVASAQAKEEEKDLGKDSVTLLPRFLTVMDRPDDPAGRVRSGNEWVVAARLADARFFYGEDKKVGLERRAEQLERLAFHEKLGSYADKSRRLMELASAICEQLGWHEEKDSAREAARLAKADLATELVKEFTSLQGVMGGIYAREEGQPPAVWQAIYDQYRPASTDDPLPRGRVGLAVALADRMDTLAGIFGIGLVPTGSRDPFGLRRAAQAAVRIALEADMELSLEAIVSYAVDLYGDRVARPAAAVVADLHPFLQDRVRYLLGLHGYAYDEIEAALAASIEGHPDDLPDLLQRVAALHEVRERPEFLSIVLAAKRIANILKGAPSGRIDQSLLAEPAERQLATSYETLHGEVHEAAVESDYRKALAKIAEFAPVLDRFFVEVMVMVEDQAVRANRIALLQAIGRTLSRIAKLTEMVVDRAELRARAQE
ncbi:MAG TPA: glycine--tRNA ligase subunit beta, partial [Thermoanaerobaculia bacterium]